MLDNSKVLIVSGSFSETGGAPDVRVDSMLENLSGAMIINGGLNSFLTEFITNGIKDYKEIYYLADYSNKEIEEALKNNKIVVIKAVSDKLKDKKAISEAVSKNNCHILIDMVEGEESPLFKVYDISGEKLVESSDFTLVTEKLKEKELLRQAVNSTAYVEPVKDPVITMERLHLRVCDDTIDILYRPVHTYIAFFKNDDEGKKKVKELALMTRDEFSNYLEKEVLSYVSVKKDKVANISGTHDEEWWKGAWKVQTDKLLKELGVTNPIEEPIWR